MSLFHTEAVTEPCEAVGPILKEVTLEIVEELKVLFQLVFSRVDSDKTLVDGDADESICEVTRVIILVEPR